MKSIAFQDLALSEAEDLIIGIWMLLEKYQLATPALTSRWTGGRLALEFTFESAAQRAFVEFRARALQKRDDRAPIVIDWIACRAPSRRGAGSPEPVSRADR